jgi:hypothetical protein
MLSTKLFFKFKPLLVIILVIILFIECTSSRFILSGNQPQVIQEQLTKKDIDKHVVIYLKNGDAKTGALLSMDDQKLVIFDKDTKTRIGIPYDTIEKIEIIKTTAWVYVITGAIILLGYAFFKIMEGIGDAIQNMGV